MEVRCTSCEKRFRIPDEKVSGKGIRFSCTRCGAVIIVKKEEPSGAPAASTSARKEPEASLAKASPAAVPPEIPKKQESAPQAQTAKNESIEVRCPSCDKHFRVPHAKFAGKGIRFSCTRCGEAIKITKEDFEMHLLSQATLFTLDLASSKPLPEAGPASASNEKSASEDVAPKEPQLTFTAPNAATIPVSDAGAVPVSSAFATETAFSSQGEAKEKIRLDEERPFEIKTDVPVAAQEAFPAAPDPHDAQMEATNSAADFTTAFPTAAAFGETEPAKEEKEAEAGVATLFEEEKKETEANPELTFAEGLRRDTARITEDVFQEPLEASIPETTSPQFPGLEEQEPEKPLVEDAELKAVLAEQESSNAMPENLQTFSEAMREEERANAEFARKINFEPKTNSRAAGKLVTIVVAALLAALLGYAAVSQYNKRSTAALTQTHDLATIEGLLITSVTGTMDDNGDILISGTLENTTDKEKTAWLVVVEVYDVQGVVLNKIRLLNGKQLYTQREYDILAGRGVNIQNLKEKYRQEQGVVIAPKSVISFSVRYVHPPAGVASFKALLQPFDPIRLFQEISENAR